MVIPVVCSSCKQKLTFPDSFRGMMVQCPNCMSDMRVTDGRDVSQAPVKPAPGVRPIRRVGAQPPAATPSGVRKPAAPVVPKANSPAAPPRLPATPARPPHPPTDLSVADAVDDAKAAFEPAHRPAAGSSRGRSLLIAGLVLLLIAGLGIGGFFLFQDRDEGAHASLEKEKEPGVTKAKETETADKAETKEMIVPVAKDSPLGKDATAEKGGRAEKDAPIEKDAPVVAKAGAEIECAVRVDLGQPIHRIRIDRDGKALYALLDDSSIRKVDMSEKSPVEAVPPHPRKRLIRGDIAIAPDGMSIARGLHEHGIDLIDLVSGEATPLVADKNLEPGRLTYSPDGKRLYAQLDGIVSCFDVATKRLLFECKGKDEAPLLGWGLSPEGRVIAAGGGKNDFYLFDASTGRRLHETKVSETEGDFYAAREFRLAFSADGTKAAGGWKRHVHVWHLPSHKQRPHLDIAAGLPYVASPGAVAFFQEGERIAAASNRGRIFIQDVLTGQRRAVLKMNGDHGSAGVVLGLDDRVLAAGHGTGVVFWNLADVPLDPVDSRLAAIADPTDVAKVELPLDSPIPGKEMPGKAVPFDQFGNPQGNFGLGQEDEFKGKKILVWADVLHETKYVVAEDNPLWVALRRMGFEVTLAGPVARGGKDGNFPHELLKEYDQLWVFSSRTPTGKGPDADRVADFVKAGKGLYLLADNDPYHVEANAIGGLLFGTRIHGNYPGERIAFVEERRMDDAMIRKFGGRYAISDQPLLTGVNFIYEGISISTFQETPTLQTVMYASDGKPLIGIAQMADTRVVLDCGFTRYFFDAADPEGRMSFINRAAGSLRFGQNVAAFLAGKGRVESFAKLGPPKAELPGFLRPVREPFGKGGPKFPGDLPGLLPGIPLDPRIHDQRLNLARKIEPFLGGWIDAGARAALFVLPKSGLKVYSYPDWKPRTTWKLAGPAQRVAFDKDKGLMYALVPNYKGGDVYGKRGGSQLMVFDVREARDALVKPPAGKEQLAPTRTFDLPGFCTQIFLSQDGASLLLLENKDARSARALRVGIEGGKVGGAVPLHEFTDGMRLSPDGTTLYAIAHDGVRSTAKPGSVGGKLQVIDTADMKLRHAIDVAVDPHDLDVAADGVVFIAGHGPGKTDIAIVDAGKKALLAVWKGVPAGCCLKFDEAGRRLFVRSAKGTRTSAVSLPLPVDYAGSDLPRAAWSVGHPTSTRGEILLAPDGRFLLCDSGQIFFIGAPAPGGFGGLGGFPAR